MIQTPRGAALKRVALTEALQRAFFEEWAKVGYAALSLEAVVRRAGVGKAALYRRWRSKNEMAVDCLTAAGINLIKIEDTGSLRSDLFAFLRHLRAILRLRLVRHILPDLHAEMGRNSSLAALLRRELQEVRRNRAKDIIVLAQERGELPNAVDLNLGADMLGALIYWRIIITKERADDRYLNCLVKAITAGLAASCR